MGSSKLLGVQQLAGQALNNGGDTDAGEQGDDLDTLPLLEEVPGTQPSRLPSLPLRVKPRQAKPWPHRDKEPLDHSESDASPRVALWVTECRGNKTSGTAKPNRINRGKNRLQSFGHNHPVRRKDHRIGGSWCVGLGDPLKSIGDSAQRCGLA